VRGRQARYRTGPLVALSELFSIRFRAAESLSEPTRKGLAPPCGKPLRDVPKRLWHGPPRLRRGLRASAFCKLPAPFIR